MHKRSAIILAGVAVVLLLVGFVWISRTYGELMATVEKAGSSGSSYSVTVRRFGNNYRTELLYGKFQISSYQFYEGSVPPTNAVISWPKLDEFTVSFDNGMSVRCNWDSMGHDKACWERK